MRNLVITQDIISGLRQFVAVSLTLDYMTESLCILTKDGYVLSFSTVDNFQNLSTHYKLQGTGDGNADESWFLIEQVGDINALVCVSHSGSIEIIENIKEQEFNSDDLGHCSEQVGVVEGGISSAGWSPDQSTLAIVTNNNSLMLMTATWDDVQEVQIPVRVPLSETSISWCGDGETFALSSTDLVDSLTKVRIYSRSLQLLATSRTVALPGILRGLGSALAFAPNGSMIACAQKKVGNKLKIALLERNGLSHGDFEVTSPPPPLPGHSDWEVVSLHWDVHSNLLAVSMESTSLKTTPTTTTTSGGERNTTTGSDVVVQGVVQIYTRSNYHWYLKQQWSESGLRMLGFDPEQPERLYLSHLMRGSSSSSSSEAEQDNTTTSTSTRCIRVIDVAWVVNCSMGPDCTVAVIDGTHILLTPFSRSVVPPPMSLHQVLLSSPCKALSFWLPQYQYPSQHEGEGQGGGDVCVCWGLACLCEDWIHFFLGDSAGRVQRTFELNLESIGVLTHTHSRAISVSSLGDEMVVVLAGCVETTTHAMSDSLVVLRLSHDELIRTETYPIDIGRVVSITPWPTANGHADSSDCDWSKFAVSCNDCNEVFDVHSLCVSEDIVLTRTTSLPEPCAQCIVLNVPNVADDNNFDGTLFLGLSSKGRLYSGETLLASGISSFAANVPMDSLLCVTGGTRPVVRFLSLNAVATVDALGGDDQPSLEYDEPRPVERGARLVAVVQGDPRVVIQLPRGNLEAFEPRPLVLKRARTLLDKDEILTCLQLLRKQRVDLNLLVDYNPSAFFKAVSTFVSSTLAVDPELLSLLISALIPGDVTLTKYPLRKPRNEYSNGISPQVLSYAWLEVGKVNSVCEALRSCLLECLRDGRSDAINPLLCTFARQQPPQLVEALALIKSELMKASGCSSLQSVLSSPRAQSCLKYLTFLADGNQLFEAALGDCDFDLARAVARQSQMDPKQYLPLLSGFEAIANTGVDVGVGMEAENDKRSNDVKMFYRSLMEHQVYLHLKRSRDALCCGVEALDWCTSAMVDEQIDPESKSIIESKAVDLVEALTRVATSEELQEHFIPSIQQIISKHNKLAGDKPYAVRAGSNKYSMLQSLLSKVIYSHANLLVSQGKFGEAATAFLMTSPPDVRAAIDAARQLGDWQLALTIAGRHEGSHKKSTAPTTMDAIPTALMIAQEIVDTYTTGLEQGQGCAEDCFSGSQESESVGGDRSLEVAQLCIDYCKDIERAISILTLARHWKEALFTACKHNRRDLMDEIIMECTTAAQETVSTLNNRVEKVSEAMVELAVLWADRELRLQQVASTEAALTKLLVRTDASEEGYTVDDNQSEFTAASGSVYSQRSAFSQNSSSSFSSVLSIQSSTSAMSTQSTFSIHGMDHSLLSRGHTAEGERSVDAKNDKRRRRKARNKGDSRDVWGLRREGKLSVLVWEQADLGGVSAAVSAMCAALILAGGSRNISLAGRLQHATDQYAECLETHSAPEAPAYPSDWLRSRDMETVIRFQRQQQQSPNGDSEDLENWWQRVEKGLVSWRDRRIPYLSL
eukprot:gene313-571_t